MKLGMASEIIIPETEKPKSLENFLKRRFPIGYVRKLFRKNGVRLNGVRSGPKAIARPGDQIQFYIPFEKRPGKADKKKSIPARFEVLFEDEDIMVINKRAGIAVHEGKEIPKHYSLLGMLEASYRPKGIVPMLVHRIDRETSGLLLVAKRDKVGKELVARFECGEVEKHYLALIIGRLYPKEGRIDFPLPGREGRAVSAVTHYQVEKEFTGTSLVRVRIETGRMHQIRLHFAKLGHPVVMDDEHGDFPFNKRFRKASGLKRQFLHASRIVLQYRGKKREWQAALPEDLDRTLKALEPLGER